MPRGWDPCHGPRPSGRELLATCRRRSVMRVANCCAKFKRPFALFPPWGRFRPID